MKRYPSARLKLFMFFAIVYFPFIFTSCSKDEPAVSVPADNDKIIAQFEAAADSVCKESEYPNLVFGVWMPDRNLEWVKISAGSLAKTSLTRSDMFCCASITKTFTAVLAMQLVEQGKISLSDNLDSLLPHKIIDTLKYTNKNFRSGKISLKMLLNHTSAIPDFSDDSSFIFGQILPYPNKQWDPADVAIAAFKNSIDTAGLGKYSYSNTNYILLGMIIEKASGKKFNALLKESIFNPCGMTKSYMSGYDNSTEPIAAAYFSDGSDVSSMNYSWDWSCGGMITNIDELYSFFHAFNAGRLVSANTMASMLSFNIYYSDSLMQAGCGLGLFHYSWQGITGYGHSGATLGYNAVMYYVPVKNAYIIGFTNEYNNDLPDKLLRSLLTKLP